MFKNVSLAVVLLLSTCLYSQVPNTDVWLFKIKPDKKTATESLQEPLNITSRQGYDNQPVFSPNNKRIYYVSIREDKQADIYFYEIGSKKHVAFTKTRVSEYSPQFTNKDQSIASVVVEADSAQRIHFINLISGLEEKKLDMDSVGYYTFLNADTVLYYKLTQPHSLRYHVISSGEDRWLADGVIRSFKAINRHTFVYGLKDSAGVLFYIYDFHLRKAKEYAGYASLNEDIVWHPQYGLVKSEDARLLRYDEASRGWVLLYDLASFGINKITRFVFDSKNRYLVLVNNL